VAVVASALLWFTLRERARKAVAAA
jgi:hypothetical protein